MRPTIPIRHVLLAGTVTFFADGCAQELPVSDAGSDGALDVGGALGAPALHLPVPAGTAMPCTQGPGGTFSHDARATRHDLDFDTPNDRDVEVYAPVAGIAFVHADDPGSGFGVHVNVDLLDGTYATVAHLREAFVHDGAEVVPGTLLGYEGCTGACTGDHVHMGVHRGDASLPAVRGESVPSRVILADGTADGAALACGIGEGDAYVSALPVPLRHPDGALVKTPDSPRVYQLDGGDARHIVDEAAFHALGYDFADVVTVSAAELACYGVGATISSPADLGWAPVTGLAAGTYVREMSRSDVYAVTPRALLPVADWHAFLLLGADPARVRFVPDGTLAATGLPRGDCATGLGCVTAARVTRCDAPIALGMSPDDGGEGGPLETPATDPPADEGEPVSYPSPGSGEGMGEGEGEQGPGDAAPARRLSVEWVTPFQAVAARITLSGEYRFADGTLGFSWHELVEAEGVATIAYALEGAGGGDTFRFSVEYEMPDGHMGWSCVGPYDAATGQFGSRQGTARADVGGQPVPVNTADDPESLGCGLFLTVP